MSIIKRLTEQLKNPPLNEDGEPQDTQLLPGLSDEEIAELERELHIKLSPECKSLLGHAAGLEEGPMEIIEFAGTNVDYLSGPLNDRLREISPDGFGNFWFYWRSNISSDLGPIYYYQHEGPMLFYQSDTLVDFVSECLRFMTPPFKSLIDDVHEFRIKPIRKLNDDLITYETASLDSDHVLKSFAKSMPEGCSFYDFRKAKVGDGVDLAKRRIIGIHEKYPIIAIKEIRPAFDGQVFSFVAFFVAAIIHVLGSLSVEFLGFMGGFGNSEPDPFNLYWIWSPTTMLFFRLLGLEPEAHMAIFMTIATVTFGLLFGFLIPWVKKPPYA